MHQPDVLARIVADLKHQAADHIAVTGDLVNLALPAEYPARARLARSAWLATRRHLGSRQSRRLCAQRLTASLAHWREFMRGDDGGAAAPDFPFLRRRGPLALIGVSTSVPSLPLLATGRVGKAQLQRLAALLEEPAATRCFAW